MVISHVTSRCSRLVPSQILRSRKTQPALHLYMSQNPRHSPSGKLLPKTCSDIEKVYMDMCIYF